MTTNILWLDNDTQYLSSYVSALCDAGFDVTTATSLLEAENLIKANEYNLVILDVMIPTRYEKDEIVYQPSETDHGHKSGLVFYTRMRELLRENHTHILVMTVRLDKVIVDEFMKSGLPRDHITTKFNLRRVPDFVGKVKELLDQPKDK